MLILQLMLHRARSILHLLYQAPLMPFLSVSNVRMLRSVLYVSSRKELSCIWPHVAKTCVCGGHSPEANIRPMGCHQARACFQKAKHIDMLHHGQHHHAQLEQGMSLPSIASGGLHGCC